LHRQRIDTANNVAGATEPHNANADVHQANNAT
jgi:hypothetical protein